LAGHQGIVQSVTFSPDGRLVASGGYDRTLAFWEGSSGLPITKPTVHRDSWSCLTFSPDSKSLVSGGRDKTAVVWEREARLGGGARGKELGPKELDALWSDLAGDDVVAAQQAVWDLAGQAKVVAFLKERLGGPVPEVNGERIKKLIIDLDDDDFQVRES